MRNVMFVDVFLFAGKEHDLGFFVTAVANGSPAINADLKVYR